MHPSASRLISDESHVAPNKLRHVCVCVFMSDPILPCSHEYLLIQRYIQTICSASLNAMKRMRLDTIDAVLFFVPVVSVVGAGASISADHIASGQRLPVRVDLVGSG